MTMSGNVQEINRYPRNFQSFASVSIAHLTYLRRGPEA